MIRSSHSSVFLALMMLEAAMATSPVTLLFVGDVSFSGPVKYYAEQHFNSYSDIFGEVATYIREADVSVANLESPYITEDVYSYQYKGYKRVILDASPESAAALSFAGFDAVTLANNHLNDFGTEGVRSSVQVLKNTGIKYFGVSYGKYDSAQEPLILERKGIKIGFLGYCDPVLVHKNCTEIRMAVNAGPAVYRNNIVAMDVARLKPKVDIIVVFMHWGEEFNLQPLQYQIEITEYLMSIGVHVIIGTHPHVLQRHCCYGNKVAAFSLGNFLFPPGHLPAGGNSPGLYGRLGEEPNEKLIESFEHFVLGDCEALKQTLLFRVVVTKLGVTNVEYLPAMLLFDNSKKLLHPVPLRNGKWVPDNDHGCQKCF